MSRAAAAVIAATLLAAVVAVAALPGRAAGQGDPAPLGPNDIRIYRDAYGIPHIEAGSTEALAYGTGFALLQDRPFLTLAIRLVAQGRSTELLGEQALPADLAMRRDFYDRADVQRQYEALPASVRSELEAYSAGINDAMKQVMADPERRPALFDALGYEPEPWTPTDSVSVTMLFTYAIFAGEGGAGQLRNAVLLNDLQRRFGRRGGRRMWEDLVFRNDPRAPSVVAASEGPRVPRAIARERAGREQLELVRKLAPAFERTARTRVAEGRVLDQVLKKLPLPKIGSYGVAVGGSLSASGGGMLIGSPQAGLNSPPVFWQLGQRAPGRDCAGFTVPGLGPWTGVGWCQGHAWTLVAGNAGEQVDHYVETIDPNAPRRYRYRGAWRDMEIRRETFKLNRCVPPVCSSPSPARTEVVEIEQTVHGPVVARDRAQGIAITQRRAQRGRWAQSLEAVAGWNSARDYREFSAATARATGTYNLLYADASGRIAYRFTGMQPTRARGIDRRLPSPGDGRFEWPRMLRYAEMPHVVSPRKGLLAVNQGIEAKPAAWWPNASGITIGQAQRTALNRGLLAVRAREAGGKLDPAALERAYPELLERRDWITSIFAPALRRALRPSRDERLRTALALLDEWERDGFARVDRDGDGRYDHPALTIFGADDFNLPSAQYPRHLWTGLFQRVFADELGAQPQADTDRGTFQAPGFFLAQQSRLKRVLDGRRGGLSRDWADDVRTKRRERIDDHVRASVLEAMDRLEREFGSPDPRTWLRPVPRTPFVPFGVSAPGPVTGFDHGTYSQLVDPRAGVGRYILPPGNVEVSGSAELAAAALGQFPPHADDQRAIYERYGFIDMLRSLEAHRAAATSVTELRYPSAG